MSDARGKGPGAEAVVLNRGADPLVGRVINDRFRVLALIARGGMGRVYRAEQQPLGRLVALKVLAHSEDDNDPDFQQRFFLEAATCAKLRHGNTVTVFDYGRTDDDVYFIAMELLEGRTLRQAMTQDGPFSPGRATHVALQIGRSLREAHGMGVTHRDLKPGNVFLIRQDEESDFVKVLDFGLVKTKDRDVELTQTGQFMGSPKYIAPEQIRGREVDGRADVYSLGVLLYEMLTGKPPFKRDTTVDTLMAHIQDPVPPMAETNPEVVVPQALEAVVLRCLRKPRDDRFPSMDALMTALKAAASMTEMSLPPGGISSTGMPIIDGPPGPPPGPLEATRILSPEQSSSQLPDPLNPSSISETPGFASMGQSSGRGRLVGGVVGGAVVIAGLLGLWAWSPGGTAQGAHRGGHTATHAAMVPGAAGAHGAAPATGTAPPAAAPPGPPGTGTPAAPTPPTAGTGRAPAAAAPTPPPAGPEPVLLHLESDPAGARVSAGGHALCPHTPCEVTWHPHSAGETLRLRFHRRGYRETSVDQPLTGKRITVDAHLPALRRGRRVRHPHPAPPDHAPVKKKKKKKTPGLDQYKANPY